MDNSVGSHKGCGSTVKRVQDEENWPDESILVCQSCKDVVTQNEVE